MLRTGYLSVPGAKLYYEVRGSGPPLLMIHGGAVDAGSFAAVAPELAVNYTVITYDRRGNSRSKLDSPPTETTVAQQAEDAAQLLKELTDTPPHVFGSSGGAIVALEMAARYSARLNQVVAHEPPVPAVLPNAAEEQAKYEAVYRTYREKGPDQAFQQFMAIDPEENDPPTMDYPADPDLGTRIRVNIEHLLAHEMLPFIRYQPNTAVKKPIIAHGKNPARTAAKIVDTLAAHLGSKPVEFPPGHTGYMWHPRDFATKLRTTLS
jgi:acetyltransferase/esterase